MNLRVRWIGAIVIIAVFAYGGYRVFLHSNAIMAPTIITPKMDAHRALSPQLPARVDRLLHERDTGDRSRRPRLIALTFDDGPYPVMTPLLLDTLRDLHVHATFFYIGRDAEQNPELTRRTALEGHELADHTFSHPNLDQLPLARVSQELITGAKVLHRFSADAAIDRFFRPPHGRYTEDTIRVAQQLGFLTILWNDDAGDWRSVRARDLAAHIEAHATAPEILLLHSGRAATIEMLPEIVARFRAAGFRFVTVGELLKDASVEETNHPLKGPV